MPHNSFGNMRRTTPTEQAAINKAVQISANSIKDYSDDGRCFFCKEYPMPMIGEPFRHYFGVAVCEWCWESDEYMDWSEQKCKEQGISLDGKTWIVSDETAEEWRNYKPPLPLWKRLILAVIERVKLCK